MRTNNTDHASYDSGAGRTWHVFANKKHLTDGGGPLDPFQILHPRC